MQGNLGDFILDNREQGATPEFDNTIEDAEYDDNPDEYDAKPKLENMEIDNIF